MKRIVASMIVIAMCHYLSAGIVVTGDSTSAPFGFTSDITAQTYDRRTGTFFVGLTSSGSDNTYTISKAPRPTFKSTPAFAAVLQNSQTIQSSLLQATIEFLKFSPQSCGLDVLTAVAQGDEPMTAMNVTSLYTDGSFEIASDDLNDASGAAVTSGIIQIETNSNTIYAAVAPSSDAWGAPDSGIALISLGSANNIITLDIKNATTGNSGNQASPLDASSTVLKGDGGGADVIFTNTFAAMHWDCDLCRLFVGVHIESGPDATDIAKGVTVGRLDPSDLVFQAIAPDGAISGAGVDEIVVAQGASIPVNPHHIRTLHASTGPDYLIVDCSTTGTAGAGACNRVFALPLVNDCENPDDELNGTIADKESALDSSTHKFTIPAENPGELPVNNPVTDPAAVVGAGDLPIETNQIISDMVVVGDAVYVSLNLDPDVDTDTGIWVSQAMFDDTGKIIRWTPWTAKRVIPINAFQCITLPGGGCHTGQVAFFEVDAKTGSVWYVEGNSLQTVGITTWTNGIACCDLVTQLSKNLCNGSYSVLDLNQSTRGFVDATLHRYALFGGVGKVVIARTGQATTLSDPASPQEAITDYCCPENLRTTLLPGDSECVHVLEYSRTSTVDDANPEAFFFAGTDDGLYVYSKIDTNEGFNPTELALLNEAPFTEFAWKRISTISGSIVDIKTSGAGGALYVVTSETSCETPLSGKVLSIPFATTSSAMFAEGNIRTIAQTATGIFSKVSQFYGVEIVATDDPLSANPENKEQLVLATNQGLYRSEADQAVNNGISDAANQTAANWQLVIKDVLNTTATTMFNGISGMDTPIRHTTWPFSVQDACGCKTFDRGSIHQYSGAGDDTGDAPEFADFFNPLNFNANACGCDFKTLDPIIYFYSDGGRRFFVFNRTCDPADVTKIGVLPYNVCCWNAKCPTIIDDPKTCATRRFYWVRLIGPTGIVLAGTNGGVVGLQ